MAEKTLSPSPRLLAQDALDMQISMRWGVLVGLWILALIVFLLLLSLGSVDIPLRDIVAVLTGGEASKTAWTNIVLKFRLPKALTAMFAGAALAVSGLQMQTFFRNPLAGPFVLGISSGASLGVALVVLSTGSLAFAINARLAGDFGIALASSLGAGGVMFLVLVAARRVDSPTTLLILGLMFSYLTGALVSLLLYFSMAEQIQAYINWTFGSFGSTTWDQLRVFIPLIGIGLGLAMMLAKALNALQLGETYARSMGVSVQRARAGIILSTAILAGTVTAFCGPIGFIGIAVPHLSRSLLGRSDHRLLMPATMLIGAIVAGVAALVAELPGSNLVLPLNAVTALMGAPVVMWVILRQRNIHKAF